MERTLLSEDIQELSKVYLQSDDGKYSFRYRVVT